MDQYMTPVQQQDMGGVQYPPQQMAYPQQQMQQGSMPVQHQQMMPAMMATPVADEFVAPLTAAKTPAIPEWVRDALIVAGVAFVIGHPSTRATLSQWLPMLAGDRRDSLFGLLIFGLLVGGGSVTINRLIIKN